jgi:hypothetical protein
LRFAGAITVEFESNAIGRRIKTESEEVLKKRDTYASAATAETTSPKVAQDPESRHHAIEGLYMPPPQASKQLMS